MKNFKDLLSSDFKGKVYFGSDFHLNHSNIAGPTVSKWDKGYRNFNSTSEMNEHILQKVNEKVKWDDILIFHGDFCFGGHKLSPNWRSRINCQTIYWITGNHDNQAQNYSRHFTLVTPYLEYNLFNQDIVSFHYPILTWNGVGKGVWCIHGHCHGNHNIQKLNQKTKRLDVGIDSYYDLFGEYNVFSFEEVKNIMDKKDILVLDHHDKNTNIK